MNSSDKFWYLDMRSQSTSDSNFRIRSTSSSEYSDNQYLLSLLENSSINSDDKLSYSDIRAQSTLSENSRTVDLDNAKKLQRISQSILSEYFSRKFLLSTQS